MNMQALALAFLAATAIGGLAWVFHLSAPVGREEGRASPRLRREAGAGRASGRKDQRSRREQVEGSLKDLEARRQKEKKLPLSRRLTQAGLDWSTQKFMVVSGILGGRHASRWYCCRRRPARRPRPRIRRRLRSAALGAELSQEAPGKELPQGAAGCRRRDRPRHQGRPAAVRIDQGRRRRRAGSAARASSWPSSRPRRSACRSARPARGCSNGCRCRRRTSSAS